MVIESLFHSKIEEKLKIAQKIVQTSGWRSFKRTGRQKFTIVKEKSTYDSPKFYDISPWSGGLSGAWCGCSGDRSFLKNRVGGKIIMWSAWGEEPGITLYALHNFMKSHELPHLGIEVRTHQARIFLAEREDEKLWISLDGLVDMDAPYGHIIKHSTNRIGVF